MLPVLWLPIWSLFPRTTSYAFIFLAFSLSDLVCPCSSAVVKNKWIEMRLRKYQPQTISTQFRHANSIFSVSEGWQAVSVCWTAPCKPTSKYDMSPVHHEILTWKSSAWCPVCSPCHADLDTPMRSETGPRHLMSWSLRWSLGASLGDYVTNLRKEFSVRDKTLRLLLHLVLVVR